MLLFQVEEWIGSPIELIPGSYEGYLNTFEAFADIHFNIRGPLGKTLKFIFSFYFTPFRYHQSACCRR